MNNNKKIILVLCIIVAVIIVLFCVLYWFLETQLSIKFSNRTLDFTKRMNEIEIVKLAIGRTRTSVTIKPLRTLAHYDVLAFDEYNNVYVIFTMCEDGAKDLIYPLMNPHTGSYDTKNVTNINSGDDGTSNDSSVYNLIIDGERDPASTRSLFVTSKSDLSWKYTIDNDKLYAPRNPLTLADIAEKMSKESRSNYSLISNNCYHLASRVVQGFTDETVISRDFKFIDLLIDVPSIILNLNISGLP